MGNFYDQSHICGKYIKDVGCVDRLKNRVGNFYDQSRIYGKDIKDVGCGGSFSFFDLPSYDLSSYRDEYEPLMKCDDIRGV